MSDISLARQQREYAYRLGGMLANTIGEERNVQESLARTTASLSNRITDFSNNVDKPITLPALPWCGVVAQEARNQAERLENLREKRMLLQELFEEYIAIHRNTGMESFSDMQKNALKPYGIVVE